jgi:hypothetical protein
VSNVTVAIQKMRDTLHQVCKDLPPKEYLQVLEELAADMDSNIDALRAENEELFR